MIEPKRNDMLTVGWREWTSLPDLNIKSIEAKIDTGARTSALHATHITPFMENGIPRVRFTVTPTVSDLTSSLTLEADIHDQRDVMGSNGHSEQRYVIVTTLQIGMIQCEIEISLTNREKMAYPLLLGRTALPENIVIKPNASYMTTAELTAF